MGCFGLKMMMKNPTKKKSLIASAIFVAFVSTVFAGCYYDRTITGVIIAICTAITATMIATAIMTTIASGATTVIIAGMITGIETIGLAGTA